MGYRLYFPGDDEPIYVSGHLPRRDDEIEINFRGRDVAKKSFDKKRFTVIQVVHVVDCFANYSSHANVFLDEQKE